TMKNGMMKAALIRSFGGPEVLSYEEIPTPTPGPGKVLVKVEAVGANYYDLLIRSGAVSSAIPLPHVGGSDIVGMVIAKAGDVAEWEVGDRVIVAPGYATASSEQRHSPENEAPSYFPTGTFEWGGYAQCVEVAA